MFQNHLKQFQEHFKNSSGQIFQVNVDREKIWEIYLSGFSEDRKQHNNCNCCKSFLRQYGGMVFIDDKNNRTSLWDFEPQEEEFAKSVELLRKYVNSLEIANVFACDVAKIGTAHNFDLKRDVQWSHYNLNVPMQFVKSSVDAFLGQKRDDKNTFERALKELTVDSVETVLEVIDQGSLYRGNEFKRLLQKFINQKIAYDKVAKGKRSAFCWRVSDSLDKSICRIRNSAIGTLLVDLSEGKDLDRALAAFERVVAPARYKRPKAIVTKKTIESAEKRLEELGLKDSLRRRQLLDSDVSVEDVIFVDRTKELTDDVFSSLKESILVNPKSLKKVEEVSIGDFIKNIVPNAKSIKALVEKKHFSNLVSLVGAEDKDSPTMFKWGNNFSWSYAGDFADSIKERVKAKGGKVDGDVRVSLSWFNHDDLDLHCIEKGHEIFYMNKGRKSPSGGVLDVDMNAGYGESRTPVENICWANSRTMKDGEYKIFVKNFCSRDQKDFGFEVEIEILGELYNFEFESSPRYHEKKPIRSIIVEGGEISVKGNAKTSVTSSEKWGVKSNYFTPVKMITTSPNHWGGEVGNKHYIFILDGCQTDEKIRPFFNEFLKEELLKEKRVFEVLGDKMKVDSVEGGLSGIGFSETKRESILFEVEGKFKRVVRVNF
jgi:hypothetical protein